MPVRIYDISKKLGLENKEVLTKAKELGIAAARVASSSLDKITAEYLEQQLVLAYPERTALPSPVAPSPGESTPSPASSPVEPAKAMTTSQVEVSAVLVEEATPSVAILTPVTAP